MPVLNSGATISWTALLHLGKGLLLLMHTCIHGANLNSGASVSSAGRFSSLSSTRSFNGIR